MKATGVVRKIDDLGRITIPMEIRRSQGWEIGCSMEMFMSEDGLVIRNYETDLGKAQLVKELKMALSKTEDEASINAIKKAISKIATLSK